MAPWTVTDLPNLEGRNIVVTGANSGLGFETVRALAGAGATVTMACRDLARAEDAAAAVRRYHPRARLELLRLDLASLDSVADFAERLAERCPRLDVLCNNAGVMALPWRQTADGFEMQFGTNHLGHFALTGRLLPLLLAAPDSRVVTVSSIYHRFGRLRWDDLGSEATYRKWPAYSMSKLANLLFATELQRRLAGAGHSTISVAAHPGYSATNLQQAGPRLAGATWTGGVMAAGNALLAQSAARGALPQLYACAAPEVVGGAYYGPAGPFELWGSPRRVEPVAAARSVEDAARLWILSEELTGVGYAALATG